MTPPTREVTERADYAAAAGTSRRHALRTRPRRASILGGGVGRKPVGERVAELRRLFHEEEVAALLEHHHFRAGDALRHPARGGGRADGVEPSREDQGGAGDATQAIEGVVLEAGMVLPDVAGGEPGFAADQALDLENAGPLGIEELRRDEVLHRMTGVVRPV